MTYEEIDALVAGRELDGHIAEKVFGYRWVKPVPDKSRMPEARILFPPSSVNEDFVDCSTDVLLSHEWFVLAPRYSTEIATAWEVIEKMRERGYEMGLLLEIWSKGKDAEPFQAWFRHKVYFQNTDDSLNDDFHGADAETAPLAICRAALKAVQRD